MKSVSRWTIAVSATAAFMILGLGLTGLATAAGEDTLTTLSLPGPLVGDEVRYEYIQTEGGLDGSTIVDGPRDGFSFAFRSPRIAYDAGGEPHMANSYYEISWGWQDGYDENYRPMDEQVWEQQMDWTHDIDVVSGEVVAYWHVDEQQEQDLGNGRVMVSSQGYIQYNHLYGTERSDPYRFPCLTFNVFQEHSVAVTGAMELFDTECAWIHKEMRMGDFVEKYIPVSIERFGSLSTVHFVAAETENSHLNGGRTHVWLSSDYPYPVKIAHPLDSEGERYDVYVMTDFIRGDAPLATAEDADRAIGKEGIQLDSAPVRPWGPDASSIVEGYTVNEAWSDALADPDLGLQAFLDREPDAYTARLEHDHSVEEDSGGEDMERTVYDFVVAGYVEDFGFIVEHEVRNGHDDLGKDEDPVTTVTVSERPVEFENPAPDLAPETVLTVPSVADLWRTLGGHDRPEDTFTFSVFCGSRACDVAAYEVEVGHAEDYYRAPFNPEELETALGAEREEEDHRRESDTLRVSIFQDRLIVGSQSQRVEIRPSGTDEVLAPESDPVLTQSALTADSVWEFPSAAAMAGIGAGSLLLGGVVAGWPALKGGILAPLFSRVHRGEAFEHPMRRRVMDVVNANPGIHLQNIVDAVDAPRSTVLHHLRTLERVDLVTVERAGHYTCYFSKDRAARLSMKAAPVVKAAGARALLEAIGQAPGITVKAAATAAGLSLSTAYYHVRRLKDADLVALDAHGDGAGLSITQSGNATLADILR